MSSPSSKGSKDSSGGYEGSEEVEQRPSRGNFRFSNLDRMRRDPQGRLLVPLPPMLQQRGSRQGPVLASNVQGTGSGSSADGEISVTRGRQLTRGRPLNNVSYSGRNGAQYHPQPAQSSVAQQNQTRLHTTPTTPTSSGYPPVHARPSGQSQWISQSVQSASHIGRTDAPYTSARPTGSTSYNPSFNTSTAQQAPPLNINNHVAPYMSPHQYPPQAPHRCRDNNCSLCQASRHRARR